MPNNQSERSVISSVGEILRDYNLGNFHHHWEIGRKIIGASPVNAFYIHRVDSSGNDESTALALNVAVLTGVSVVDIEGDVTRQPNLESATESSNVSILPLRAISAVEFHMGPIQTLRESANAKLVLLVEISGNNRIGRYWVADSDDEYENLLMFGKDLADAVVAVR